MAFVSRYRSLSTYTRNEDTYARRVKRLSKSLQYIETTTANPTTLDLLSLQFYGTPLMYWAIADFNDYLDPTVTIPAGTTLKIPSI